MKTKVHERPPEWTSSQRPELALLPNQGDRELQLLRLGVMSGRELCAEDSARLSGELPVPELRQRLTHYLQDCELENNTNTLRDKAESINKLFWYLNFTNAEKCGEREIRGFLSYVKNSHASPNGRWEKGAEHSRYRKPVSKRTVECYLVWLKTFYRWMLQREFIFRDPTAHIKVDKPKPTLIVPFSLDQVQMLVKEARRSALALRNEAIFTLMFDTGIREAEFCNVRLNDIEFSREGGRIRVLGKGDKERMVPFGRKTRKLLGEYLASAPMRGSLKVWTSRAGTTASEALTPNGLYHLYTRTGKAASIYGVRCSPHTMRHTFAINYLRNKGTVETLQYLLGHEKIEMT